MQAGASTVAMLATSAMLSNDNAFGQFVAERNSTLTMQHFMQGTFENMLLASGGMWIGSRKGESLESQLLSQNWAKTQYTLVDYAAAEVSRHFKDMGEKQAESARKAMEDWEKKEGLLGLAWLGLRKAGSLLSSAVDGIAEWLDRCMRPVGDVVSTTAQRVVNWLRDGKWVTDREKLQVAVGAAYAYIDAMEEYGRMAKQAVLDDFSKDTREKTDARIYALKEAGIDTADIEAEVARRRKAIEDRKQQEQAKAEKEAVQVKEAGVGSIINSILRIVGFVREGKVIKGVTYLSQRDNETKDGIVNGNNMCSLTTLAMVMNNKGIDVGNGRKQYEDRLYDIAKEMKLGGENLWNDTRLVYKEIFKYINEKNNTDYIIEIKDAKKVDFEKEVKKLIDQNKPVIASGNFPNGHIIAIVGYNNEGWIVHDPYGNANTGFKDTNGRYVHYKYGKYDIGKKWFAFIR